MGNRTGRHGSAHCLAWNMVDRLNEWITVNNNVSLQHTLHSEFHARSLFTNGGSSVLSMILHYRSVTSAPHPPTQGFCDDGTYIMTDDMGREQLIYFLELEFHSWCWLACWVTEEIGSHGVPITVQQLQGTSRHSVFYYIRNSNFTSITPSNNSSICPLHPFFHFSDQTQPSGRCLSAVSPD